MTLHVAKNTSGRTAIDERTTRHGGYAIGRRVRKRTEEAFGWIKTLTVAKVYGLANAFSGRWRSAKRDN
ncbi:hypothetical protein ACVWXN_006759 [Bradyrhizobium sp. i1.4.4]